MISVAVVIIVVIVMLVAAAGVILPILPGASLAWLALFGYGLYNDFQIISVRAVIIFLVLTALVTALEYLLPLLGAKKYRASKYGLIGACVGIIAGPFLFGFIGILIGPFIGAVAGELYAGRREQSIVSGFGVFAGFMVGMAFKFALVLAMLGYFVLALVK